MAKEALIIFIKNPVLGKVKTRLAQSVGDDKALEVYRVLLEGTRRVTEGLTCDKLLFYSDFVDREDAWPTETYQKFVQYSSDNLGERMMAAFNQAFSRGYEKVMIIGSDCPDLNEGIIQEASHRLDKSDVVIGPATDGGYYLLGMKQLHPGLFQHNKWSTSSVLNYTRDILEQEALNYQIMMVLSDLDDEADLIALENRENSKNIGKS